MFKVKIDTRKLVRALQKFKNRVRWFKVSIKVGYSEVKAPYGIYVHEDLSRSPRTGERKFLTNAEILVRDEYLKQIREDIQALGSKKPMKVVAIFLKAGKTIRLRSQTMVPVLTGNLRDSAGEANDPNYEHENV